MALGLPSHPPEGLEFQESSDDVSCPVCGWDREDAASDVNAAHNAGFLLAAESEQSPFTSMAGLTLYAFYWRCPDGHLFTTEEEFTAAGASA